MSFLWSPDDSVDQTLAGKKFYQSFLKNEHLGEFHGDVTKW